MEVEYSSRMPYYSNTYIIEAFLLIGDKTLSDQENRMIGQFPNCLRPKMIFWNEGKWANLKATWSRMPGVRTPTQAWGRI